MLHQNLQLAGTFAGVGSGPLDRWTDVLKASGELVNHVTCLENLWLIVRFGCKSSQPWLEEREVSALDPLLYLRPA